MAEASGDGPPGRFPHAAHIALGKTLRVDLAFDDPKDVRDKEDGEEQHADNLGHIAIPQGAEGGEGTGFTFRAGHDLQARLEERMTEIHELLAVGRDADRTDTDIRRAAFHGVEQFGHGINHAGFEFEAGGSSDLFPEIHRVALEHAVFLEGEGLGGFDHDPDFFRRGGCVHKERGEQDGDDFYFHKVRLCGAQLRRLAGVPRWHHRSPRRATEIC
jgi:hypothetical protein